MITPDYRDPLKRAVFWLMLFSVFTAACCVALLVTHQDRADDQIPLGEPPTVCYAYCDARVDSCMRFCMRRPSEVSDCCTACLVQSEVCRGLCDKSARPIRRHGLDTDAGYIY